MSNELLASKIVLFEEEPKVRGIPSLPTSVAAAVGLSQKGPFNEATLCSSFDEYEATFGGFTPTSDLALAAKGFFENGGSQLWVARVGAIAGRRASVVLQMTQDNPPWGAGPAPGAVLSTKPFPLSMEDQQYLRVMIDTYAGGGYLREIAVFGRPAVVFGQTEGPFPGPFSLTDGQSITFVVDGGAPQTVFFSSDQFSDMGAATAEEVCAVINANSAGVLAEAIDDVVYLTTISRGYESSLDVTSATASLGLAGQSAVGEGNVADLNAIEIDDIEALVTDAGDGIGVTSYEEGAQSYLVMWSPSLLPESSVQILGSAIAPLGLDKELHVGSAFGWFTSLVRFEAKTPGADGNALSVQVTNVSVPDGTFAIAILDGGVEQERFDDISRDSTLPNFVETVVNHPVTGSKLVRAINLSAPAWKVPDFGSGGQLEGGEDDPAGIPDEVFIGDEAAGTGLHAFDNVQDISLLLVPGKASAAIHNAMIQYCEVTREGSVFAILDPPDDTDAQGMVDYVSSSASLENLSEYGAIYWPRVTVLNPDKAALGPYDQIVVAPSGIVAGVYARTDSSSPGGVYVPPAGVENGRMFGVLGFQTDQTLDETFRDMVYPHRINPLTTAPALPKYIDGSRTLKGDGAFPFVAERRGVMFIERSLRQGLQFARHSNNTPELRAQVRRTITAFLLAQMNNGAFASREPARAFFVDVSDQINTPSVIAAGKLVARVGLATNKPAEFIILQISQDTRVLEAELAGAG